MARPVLLGPIYTLDGGPPAAIDGSLGKIPKALPCGQVAGMLRSRCACPDQPVRKVSD